MPVTSTPGPARPWRIVAEEASHEYDPKKMAELMQELNQAMEEQGIANSGTVASQKKSA
jgi:hypothetical protein